MQCKLLFFISIIQKWYVQPITSEVLCSIVFLFLWLWFYSGLLKNDAVQDRILFLLNLLRPCKTFSKVPELLGF